MQITRTLIAIIVGLFIGSAVNISFVKLGGLVIPLPNDLDASKMEDLKAVFSSLDWVYFIFPFLAHALGTLSGGIIALLISEDHKKFSSFTIAIFFLAGGVAMNLFMLPSPIIFTIVDLGLAYIPMALLANRWMIKD
jgi:ABC-type sugar transport system permease subunit